MTGPEPWAPKPRAHLHAHKVEDLALAGVRLQVVARVSQAAQHGAAADLAGATRDSKGEPVGGPCGGSLGRSTDQPSQL